MTKLTVAALQLAFTDDTAANIRAVGELVREAAGKGAEVVLPPELFEGPYFCRVEDESLFATARPTAEHPVGARDAGARRGAEDLDPDQLLRGRRPASSTTASRWSAPTARSPASIARATSPTAPAMRRNSTSAPATPASSVWGGPHMSTLGVGVCWDQWYPETARAMMLMGADILFYPTAIGTEPHDPDLDTSRLWRRAMIGHAVSNVVPVVAANRIGTEGGQRFYGHSFICDERGDILAEFGAEETGVLVATLDLAAAKKHRAAFGFFRDRRPELYGRLTEDV